MHAHAPSQRSIDVERLLGAAPARLRRHMGQRAHIVQPVCELDQQHPYVVRDRQQQLAQVFRLLGLFGDEFEFLELGKTFDQRADVLPEHLVDLGAGCGSILDGIVQQRGGDRGIVELEIGEDASHFEGMGEIGVSRRALLLAVGLHRVNVGAIEQGFAGLWIVALYALDQVVLPHHWRRKRLLLFYGFLKNLGDNIETTLERRPRPGLILHARQAGRGRRHTLSLGGSAGCAGIIPQGYHLGC